MPQKKSPKVELDLDKILKDLEEKNPSEDMIEKARRMKEEKLRSLLLQKRLPHR